MANKQQTDNFLFEYNRLNEQQKKAVDTIEGPVMVIAGPGTGKTQILSARIGKILLETDTSPQNILCLTFTDAGVVAMRRRLLSMIGPAAYRVHIYTFHAFCNDVIQENLSLFDKTALDPISDLERIELFRELINSFPVNHPLKRLRGELYFEARNLAELYSLMKQESWSPQFVNEKIDEFIKQLPNNDEFVYKSSRKGQWEKGDLKPAYKQVLARMEKLRAAVNEFDTYQKLMRSRNLYDFDDMINWVIKAFEENKDLLADYQERFQYILVDEFQDSSGSQNKLVELLISYWEKPNIFVVGDDDQSIFRFQGANVENMLAFYDNYKKDLLTVVLSNNYRSAQPILDISKTLISNNTERLIDRIEGLSKELISSHDAVKYLTHKPLLHEYASQRHEMVGITEQIKELLNEGTDPGEIAVIYRNNSYGDELANMFRHKNIPFYSRRNINILETPLIQQLVQLMKYIAAEHYVPYSGDKLLFEILHFQFFDIPPLDIAKATIKVSEQNEKEDRFSLRRWLREKANEPAKDLFSPSLPAKLVKASTILEGLIHAVPNNTLQLLLERIINNTGMLGYIIQNENKHQWLQLLNAFFDFVKKETRRKPYMTLQELVELIEMLKKEYLPIELVQVTGSEKAVNLLTAHGAKGLEFEHVFFAACNAGCWEKWRGKPDPYTYPNNLLKYAKSKETSRDEQRRLFYVALTRAKQYLYISYCNCSDDGRPAEPTMFIAEIQEAHEFKEEHVYISDELISEYSALQLTGNQHPEIEKLEEELVSHLLERFTMNVSALNNYLKCPVGFYYQNLVRIPSPKNKDLEYGNAVHFALQELFRKMQANNKTFPPAEECIADFNWWMKRHRESFTRNEFDILSMRGETMLRAYYELYKDTWNKIVSTERNFRTVIKGVPIRGKIDKLEFDGKNVNVVDYKTGNPTYGLEKLKRPSENDPVGGDYWRQAVFYKILVENADKGWHVVSTEYDFIEPDNEKKIVKEKIYITAEDTTTVTNQIVEAWKKIQQRDFYIGCGKTDCYWCNFVKTNKLAIALHQPEEEEEFLS